MKYKARAVVFFSALFIFRFASLYPVSSFIMISRLYPVYMSSHIQVKRLSATHPVVAYWIIFFAISVCAYLFLPASGIIMI